MKISTLTLTLISLVALIAGCASANHMKPVTGQLAKVQQWSNKSGMPVVEFTPPQGENWYEAERTKNGLVAYGKKLSDPSDTFVAYAFVTDNNKSFSDVKEFLNFVKNERAQDKNASRFSIISEAQSLDETKKERCVKYQYKGLDKSAAQKTRESIYLAAKGFTCQHPSKPYIITIEYSERSKSPFSDAALVTEGEAFINSLVLN